MGASQSQDSMNEFLIPPVADSFGKHSRNTVYQRGSNLTLRWLTNFKIFSLQFQQELVNGSSNVYALVDYLTIANKSYDWNVDSNVFNLSLPADYRVRLVNEFDDSQVIESHFFNINVSKPASTVITPSATLTMIPTSSASYSSSAIIEHNGAPADGLPTAPAIGVGLVCGSFLVFIALLFICIYRRRRNNRKRPVVGVGPDDYDDDGNYIGPLAAPSPTNSGQRRNNIGVVVGISSSPYATHFGKPLAGTAPGVSTTHSINRKPPPETAPGDHNHRRNYSRPFGATSWTAISHKRDGSITPLPGSSHVVRGMGRYIPSPSKRVGFGERLEAERYQIPLLGIESNFSEDINRQLEEISSPHSDPRFIEDLARRLSEISQYSGLHRSIHGSIYNVSPVSRE